MKVVIVEDEPFAQNEITRLLKQVSEDIEILVYLESVEEAVDWFSSNQHPPLVFFDIQLSDGISFDIFSEVSIQSSIIFTTAYDEYAIQAFKHKSIDYLLKPIELGALKAAIDKYHSIKQEFSGNDNTTSSLNVDQLSALMQLANSKSNYKSRLLTKVGDQIRFTKTTEVAYFYAEDNEVLLMNVNGKKSIIDQSLDSLIGDLDPNEFHRINRKYIVNKSSVKKVHKYFNSRLKIELLPQREEEVLISRVKVQEFLDWMEK